MNRDDTATIATATDWSELLKRLAEPFPESAVYWRVGNVSRDKKRAQALPYADPRVYEDRLNALVPGNWSVSFRPWGDARIICELSIHGVTRSSTGEENDGFAPGTAAEAQAFKRACSKFGLGRYLYDVDAPWLAYDDDQKRLLETPRLPQRFLPQAGSVNGSSRGPSGPEPAPTLPAERAEAMHREMGKLGFRREEQFALVNGVLGASVETFTVLTEDQAMQVWHEAKRQASSRRPPPGTQVAGAAARP
ncbi:MAG: hypothetical protein M3498_05455 [Deinococcota bacterium]|nr:hypothetical protein [Deinococcota bacterium]